MSGAITQGTLLNGRVRYAQYTDGYRTGIEPVLLAAFVAARQGESVLEAGTAAGAALLCLAARLPGITGTGIERDPLIAALAARNAADNGWHDRLDFRAGSIEQFVAPSAYDHAMANPPWHEPLGTPSPDPGRDRAKRTTPGLLGAWVKSLATALKPRGTLSLIVSVANLDPALAAFAANGCGSIHVLPLWPHADEAARLLLLQAVRGGRAPTRLLSGIALHGTDGYTAATDRVLRDMAPLP